MIEKFAPGKWGIIGDNLEGVFFIVNNIDKDIGYQHIICQVQTLEKYAAIDNARLIASAPEMYKMLKYLADGIRCGGIQHTDRSFAAEIEKILKKARGEINDKH